MPDRRVKRVWVQDVAVRADVLQLQLTKARARGLRPTQEAVAHGIEEFLGNARNAAWKMSPAPSRFTNWLHGTLVDAAYQNIHAATAQIVELYDTAELRAEIPGAIARARTAIHPDDPRCQQLLHLAGSPVETQRVVLRKTIEDAYDILDRQHERLRNFRNIVLVSAVLVTILVAITVVLIAANPRWWPLCFGAPGPSGWSCPTSEGLGPRGADILVVAIVGLLGGALAATVSIRGLKGTSTPYDVPIALAMLKVPLGAFTAIVGLSAIRGDFIPGLSNLDSQEQILAYSLVLGFAQQVFTRLLDKQAQTLLTGLPAKESTAPPPSAGVVTGYPGGASSTGLADVTGSEPLSAPASVAASGVGVMLPAQISGDQPVDDEEPSDSLVAAGAGRGQQLTAGVYAPVVNAAS